MFHCLKVHPKYWNALVSGKKLFEVRFNDRNFSVGDSLFLEEFDPEFGYMGRCYSVVVTYVLSGFEGLAPGYVVLGIQRSSCAFGVS